MENSKPIIAITAGDINGIGYEIVLKSLADPHIFELCRPVIYGNLSIAKKHLQTLDDDLRQMQLIAVDDAKDAPEGKVSVVNCYPDSTPLAIGEKTKEAGQASLAALNRAVKDIKNGVTDLWVTAPINKENIQSDGFQFSGHTEYITHHLGEGKESLMMMVSEQMRVALVCNHVPVSKIPEYITEDRILHKLKILNQTLIDDFTIRKPRIAVLALNPHAGDNGLLGSEEKEIIRPAIDKAIEEGIVVFGPYAADGFFGAGHYRKFDAVLAMYHDQGLIPFKSLDMAGVNYTAGLDVIRTSPDHGTAYLMAGKNQANDASFRNALYMVLDVKKTRERNKEINANPLVVNQNV